MAEVIFYREFRYLFSPWGIWRKNDRECFRRRDMKKTRALLYKKLLGGNISSSWGVGRISSIDT